jgi:DNA-binding PadR family transcriptional regulator
MLSPADREIRLGIWKIHILHHAAARKVWGTWLLEELARHGHKLSPGTLYPALARMEANGWLARSGDAAHARARQALRITAAGRKLLRTLRKEVIALHAEVVGAPAKVRAKQVRRKAKSRKKTGRAKKSRRRER